jgi:hypothetical protein
VFDPLRVAHLIRETVIDQFSSSRDARTRLILVANVIGALGKSPGLNPRGLSVVSVLSIQAHQSLDRFKLKKPAARRELDIPHASKALDLIMEVDTTVQLFALSLICCDR